ncbi:MAG TPA: UDP-N-acetylglucosamine diphosphorylase [Planctomycetota bacterium]|nr:UDP-N-acetylglucosamine diphosphorylase [Planctomycetota bacterium]
MNLQTNDFFELEGFQHSKLFDGTTNPWEVLGQALIDYIAANIQPGIHGRVMDGAWLMSDRIEIGEGTIVEPGAMIKGPAIIGRNCEIRHTAYLRENVIVGDNCVIGHATEIKASVLLNHVEAAHFAFVGDSVVGGHAMLGAGTRLANFKVDGSEVIVYAPNCNIRTGLTKFGAIVGDGCKFGCNSVSNPGTILGKGCIIMPCTAAKGCLPAGTRVK